MIELCLADGLSSDQIGRLMAISRQAADRQLQQAMRLLRAGLDEQAQRLKDRD